MKEKKGYTFKTARERRREKKGAAEFAVLIGLFLVFAVECVMNVNSGQGIFTEAATLLIAFLLIVGVAVRNPVARPILAAVLVLKAVGGPAVLLSLSLDFERILHQAGFGVIYIAMAVYFLTAGDTK